MSCNGRGSHYSPGTAPGLRTVTQAVLLEDRRGVQPTISDRTRLAVGGEGNRIQYNKRIKILRQGSEQQGIY